MDGARGIDEVGGTTDYDQPPHEEEGIKGRGDTLEALVESPHVMEDRVVVK